MDRSMATSPVEYTIGGVKIHFPCKAYPSQLAMMNLVSNTTTTTGEDLLKTGYKEVLGLP